jgi:hypothetical protein
MIYDDYGNFGPSIGQEKPDSISGINGDIPDRNTIPVAFPDIVDNRIRPHAVQAICLVKIFNGNKTANRLCQQEYDQEQENGPLTIYLQVFVIPEVTGKHPAQERTGYKQKGHSCRIFLSRQKKLCLVPVNQSLQSKQRKPKQ